MATFQKTKHDPEGPNVKVKVYTLWMRGIPQQSTALYGSIYSVYKIRKGEKHRRRLKSTADTLGCILEIMFCVLCTCV